MNRDYLPILGEIRRASRTNCYEIKLNVIAFSTGILTVQCCNSTVIMHIESNSCLSGVLEIGAPIAKIKLTFNNTTDIIRVSVPSSLDEKIYVFNCDCHFVPNTKSWEDVDISETRLAFHVGDQIYFDRVFIDMVKLINSDSGVRDLDLKAMIYETVKTALLRKVRVLQGCFNIMLGDDHDVCDESLRMRFDRVSSERAISLLLKVFGDVQGNLRFDKDQALLHYEKTSILLFDNIKILGDRPYLDLVHTTIRRVGRHLADTENLYIMSPRVPMNNEIDCCTTCIYNKVTNDLNYSPLYNSILSLPVRNIKLFCGDEHIARSFRVVTRKKSMEIFFVGAMNSVLDGYDSNDYIEGMTCVRLTNHKLHSYVVIKEGEAKHRLIDSRTNRWFGGLVYMLHLI